MRNLPKRSRVEKRKTRLIRTLYRLLRRISPDLAALAAQSYYTLSGRRFDDLKRAFDDLKFAMRNSADSPLRAFQADHSMRRLSDARRKQGRAIAVVSIMPPDDSGVATFTRSVFSHASYGVDIFTNYGSVGDYLNGITDARLRDTNVRVFSLDALPVARTVCSYEAEIFVLANSDHYLPILLSLKALTHFRSRNRTFVHIHDPCMLNMFDRVCEVRRIDPTSTLASLYPDLGDFLFSGSYRGSHLDLARCGIYGLRPLLIDVPLDGVIVNSTSAGRFIEAELPRLAHKDIIQLFHPVFSFQPDEHIAAPKSLRIGTFGVPGESKRTELVIGAFLALRREIPDAQLVIAGFQVASYTQHNKLRREQGVIIEDSPSDERLEALMRSCHMAIQLRKFNLGESSGCVPQLLAADVPVIVSDIGSFSEYGNAVKAIPTDASVNDLVDAIKSELANRDMRRLARAGYVRDHSPEKFCDELLKLIDERNAASGMAVKPVRGVDMPREIEA